MPDAMYEPHPQEVGVELQGHREIEHRDGHVAEAADIHAPSLRRLLDRTYDRTGTAAGGNGYAACSPTPLGAVPALAPGVPHGPSPSGLNVGWDQAVSAAWFAVRKAATLVGVRPR